VQSRRDGRRGAIQDRLPGGRGQVLADHPPGEGAAAFVRGLAGQHWLGGHFLAFDHLVTVSGSAKGPDDAVLRDVGGAGVELDWADVVVMIATSASSAEAASVVGDVCAIRGIMSAGLVLDEAAWPVMWARRCGPPRWFS
jgi:hypothetical protein